jgi:hypothetical protein
MHRGAKAALAKAEKNANPLATIVCRLVIGMLHAEAPDAIALDCALRFESPHDSRPSMLCLCRASCLCRLLSYRSSVVAPAAPAHKRPAPRWHGYGFLPGYHQPPNNTLPAYAQKDSVSRMARHNRRPWYIDPVPSYYGYDGDWHYFGRPGFYGGRYNGGTFGPCWTRTPIGPIWNCG